MLHRAVALTLLVVAADAALRAQASGAPGPALRRTIEQYVEGHQQSIVRELLELLSIPNVAADKPNIRRNAEFLRAMLERRGVAAELLETAGNPLVYGELRVPDARGTLLVYCHYDGQPVEPRNWKQTDPFAPVLRTGRVDQGGRDVPAFETITQFDPRWRVYARSASDDKSPIVALVTAIDALKAGGMQPAWNVRVLLDGEEEAGSPSLVPAIGKYRDKLTSNVLLVLDGPMHFNDKPTVAFGARGIVTITLTVYGPKVGVHSGNYGNWVPNAALGLSHLLASMKDDKGNVTVKGFYDAVEPMTAEEKQMVAGVPDESARVMRVFGIAAPEKAERSLHEGLQLPTLNIRGLSSAFVGPGARTIIPDRAIAEIDIRLVKETTGEDLAGKVRAHVAAQGYHIVSEDPDEETRATHARIAGVVANRSTAAFRTSPLLPESRRVTDALTRVWGEPPVRIRTLGGTVPIAPFIETLNVPAMLVPIVNFDNNQHEENENLRLGALFQGIVTIAALLVM